MTQTSATNHRAPLAPGEIRTHRVGDQRFQVMHTGGGMFTQAVAVDETGRRTVLTTDISAAVAVKAYADAIERAESAAGPVVDLAELTDRMGLPASQQQGVAAFADGQGPWTEAEATEFVHIWQHTGQDGVYRAPVITQDGQVSPTVVADIEAERAATAALEAGPGLVDLLDAYGEAMAKAALHLTRNGGRGTATMWAGNADALKAEILARFGGGR